ncbi:MAG: hypothetical protein QM679_02225 [Patulibacter sp.]
MDARSTGLRWFHTRFDVRDGASEPAPEHRVELWLGAADGDEAATIAADVETTWMAEPTQLRVVTTRTELEPLPATAGPTCLHPDVADLATRQWGLVEGCLVQVLPDVDAVASEWLEVCDGRTRDAEATLNRVHLWDLLDDAEDTPDADHDIATGLALAWQDSLDQVPGADRIVVELHDSDDGPQLTVFRCIDGGQRDDVAGTTAPQARRLSA